ncbi:transcriptional regulator [Bizionia sediminis]|uniref:Transcriptional regulator n=1 Tax=Bizionia sediminis TaxID=1737064 RepID=A0ABW5KVY6_9FLAO
MKQSKHVNAYMLFLKVFNALATGTKLNLFKNIGLICLTLCFSVPGAQAQNQETLLDSISSYRRILFQSPDEVKTKLNNLKQSIPEADSLVFHIYHDLYGIAEAISGNPLEALTNFDLSYNFATTDKQKVVALVNQSNIYKNINENKKALELLDIAEKKVLKLKDSTGLIRIYSASASIYKNKGLLDLSVEFSLKAIAVIKATHNKPYDLNIERQKLGNTYLVLKDYKFAIQEYESILPYFNEQNNVYTAAVINYNYADALYNDGQFNKASKLNDEAVSIFTKIDNRPLLALSLTQKARLLYLNSGNLTASTEIYEQAMQMVSGENDQFRLEITLDYLNFLNDNKSVQEFNNLFKAQQDYISSQDLELTESIEFQNLLLAYHTNVGALKAALNVAENLMSLKDSLSNRQSDIRARQLQVKHKTNLLEADNKLIRIEKELLESQNALNRKQIWVLIALSLLLIVLLVALGFMINYKRKQTKLKVQFLKDENLLQARNMALKNTILNQYKTEALEAAGKEALLVKGIKDLNKAIDAKNITKAKTILKEIHIPKRTWKLIIEKFKKFDNYFIQNLLKEHPNLTASEIDFCILIKLNFTNQEIAEILNITQKSVFMKKYRIVKKMALPESRDFLHYLNTIEEKNAAP